MRPPYRRASRHTAQFLMFFFVGFAAMVALVLLLPPNKFGAVTLVAIIPLVLGVIFGILAFKRLEVRRLDGVRSYLQSQGFRVNLKPDDGAKAAVFEPIPHVIPTFGLRDGAVNVVWLSFLDTLDRQVIVFEHSYIMGSGKTSREILHTVVGMEARGDVDSFLILDRAGWLVRRTLRKTEGRIELGRESFDNDWVARGSIHILHAFLTTGNQNALQYSPVGESWHIQNGWICCAYEGCFDGSKIGDFLNWVRDVAHNSRI